MIVEVPHTALFRCEECGRLLTKKKRHGCPAPPLRGVGTNLKKIFGLLRIKQKRGCGCHEIEVWMNCKGPAWCLDNMSEIADKLEIQAKKASLPFNRAAAKALIYLAIRMTDGINTQSTDSGKKP